MDVVGPVDPRDVLWEEVDPVFRVTFWRQQDPLPGSRPEPMGHEGRAFDLAGADVHEVIDWAGGEAAVDETWTLHVLVRYSGEGLGQVQLAGSDPTAA